MKTQKKPKAPVKASDLRGVRFVLTGHFSSMTQEELAQLIRGRGGKCKRLPSKRTDFVVVGQEGWPFRADGRISESLDRARRLQDAGSKLEVITEQQLLERMSLTGRFADLERQQLYTSAQLSRILKVPGRRIRAWVRRGFLRPARSENRLDYFDFGQVSALKALHELTEVGVSHQTIRQSLSHLRRWLPEAEQTLAQMARFGREGDLLIRLEDGRLAETSGQLRLELDERSPQRIGATFVPVIAENPQSAEEWYESGLAFEEDDELEDAALAYERALQLGGPSAEIAFNLGNVLHGLGRTEEAVVCYRLAVDREPEYLEAWNNLGGILAELGRYIESIEASCIALRLADDYADAHFNLAQAYRGLGDADAVRHHAAAYLQFDPDSIWSREMRLLLLETHTQS